MNNEIKGFTRKRLVLDFLCGPVTAPTAATQPRRSRRYSDCMVRCHHPSTSAAGGSYHPGQPTREENLKHHYVEAKT